MDDKRKKYIIELRAAYASMVRALFYSGAEAAEQTLEALNAVAKVFLPQYARYIEEKELCGDEFGEGESGGEE